jgi:lipoprotein-anchoring transpeptidase ErfK/SrfK
VSKGTPWVAGAAVCAVCAVAVAGCGGGKGGRAKAPAKPAVHRCAAGAERTVGSPRVASAAIVERPTVAYRSPGQGAIARFGLLNVNHVRTVFGVLSERVDAGCAPTWLHVALPLRPNGITGWVRARDVSRATVHTRVTVDLSERRLRLYRNGRLVLSSTVAVGSRATPTPLGRYYVNQRLIPDDPTGPYGPGAVGISAFSPVLTGWAQGGPIAIHGTNEPWSIGRAVSNGCIRLPNPVLRRVFAQALAGTPVVITK